MIRMATPILLLFIVEEILVSCGSTKGNDVFASSAQLRMLDEGEADLIASLKYYVIRERLKLDELDRLVAEVEEDRRTTETRTPLVSNADHPVDVFHLIHRFITTWKGHILPLFYESTAIEVVKAVIDAVREILPTEDDYEGAKSAIIRLQKSYELSIADVINGTILQQTTRPMTQQMAVDVAVFALNRKLVDDAFLWLTHAQKHPIPPLTPLQDIYHTTSRIHAQRGQLLEAVNFAKKALEIDPSNVDYLSKVLPNEGSQTTESEWFIYEKQDRLCRQHLVQNNSSSNGTLSCFYERGRHTPMLRTKVEMLHRSPDVVMIHDFITDGESAELRRIAKSKIQRAMVGSSLKSVVTESRVGKTAWLYDNTGELLVDRLSKRISETTGLETKHPIGEPIQLANYGLGGHYNMHYDHDTDRYERVDLPQETKEAGDRMATCMIYLNNVEAGGATVFPELNLGTRPVQNAAVFWYNYKRSGFSESLSLHAACPVLIGEKWVANKWIREFGQVFRRPCDLSIDI